MAGNRLYAGDMLSGLYVLDISELKSGGCARVDSIVTASSANQRELAANTAAPRTRRLPPVESSPISSQCAASHLLELPADEPVAEPVRQPVEEPTHSGVPSDQVADAWPCRGNRLYASDMLSGLYVFDISDLKR